MKNLFKWKTIRDTLIIGLITYALIELVCFIFIEIKYVPAEKPSFTYIFYGKNWKPIFADINPIWGAWHEPGNIVSTKDCFNVSYRINSYGARDKERIKENGANRVIVLGDSFMEGYGVEENERVSNLLEKELKVEFLNFATTSMGPTQEYLLYKDLAKNFSHDKVLIGILPFNDFQDDDRDFSLKIDPKLYKPFWVGSYPDYKLTYSPLKLEDSESLDYKIKLATSFRGNLTEFLKSYTYWFNIYFYLKHVKPIVYLAKSNLPYSGYYDYTLKEFNKMKFSIENIKREAQGKEIYIFTIPVQSDLSRYAIENKVSKLGNELGAFCKNSGIHYLDLLPETYNDYGKDASKLYLSCDGHWNATGNKYTEKLLVKFLKK
ncbi:hypothetical protein [Solitalea koreensis]|nr:hypothetical protein [Solitalea koreensis]